MYLYVKYFFFLQFFSTIGVNAYLFKASNPAVLLNRGGLKLELTGVNHLTFSKQNLAFSNMCDWSLNTQQKKT